MSDITQEYKEIAEKGKRGIFHLIFGRTLVILLLLLAQFFLIFHFSFSFVQYLPYTYSGILIFTAAMMLWILNSPENPSFKLSWCAVIAILPLFGALLYCFIRFDLGHRLEQRLLQSTIQKSLVHMPDSSSVLSQVRTQDKALYNLATYTQAQGGYPIFQNTQVTYFPLGEKKFDAMLEQLEQAGHFIFLEYFAIDESYMWSSILSVLQRKAAQGVEVRVIYDGTSSIANLPYGYPNQLKKMGIQCVEFSPIRPFVSTHYNNRDHRKILVIDGHTAFTGGVNLDDRYINRVEVFGHWKDTAVMLQGEAAKGFTFMFLQMWNSLTRGDCYQPYLDVSIPHSASSTGYVIPYSDSPLDDESVGKMVYLNILNRATDYVYIMTPYLILDQEMSSALRFAARRGVDVRLILPHIPDKKYAFALAQSHYKELLDAGVKVYEYTPGFVHAKVFLSDDLHGVVGTINLDYRSLYLNFECAAYLYDVPALKDIQQDFHDTLTKCQRITPEDIRHRSLLSKLAGILLKVAAPLM